MAKRPLPRYTQKPKRITRDMLTWGDRPGPPSPRIAVAVEILPDGQPARLPSSMPIGNLPKNVPPRSCPFCGEQDPDHPDCPEYARMLANYSASVQPLRCGVPWDFIGALYAERGEVPPQPRWAYDPPLKPGEEGYDEWQAYLTTWREEQAARRRAFLARGQGTGSG